VWWLSYVLFRDGPAGDHPRVSMVFLMPNFYLTGAGSDQAPLPWSCLFWTLDRQARP